MRTIKFIAAASILMAFVACNSGKTGTAAANGADSTAVAAQAQNASDSQNPKDYLPSKKEVSDVSYLLGVYLGQVIKGSKLGDDIQYSLINKGLKDFMGAKGNERDTTFFSQFKVDPREMNRIMSDFIEKRQTYTAVNNKAESDKFLAANAAKTGVEKTESGLQYIIRESGSDNRPTQNQDTVYVHYKLADFRGNVLEEVKEEDASVHFLLSQVIPGWQEGLKLIGEGGKATLFVPSDLAYGEQGNRGIDPNLTLVFDVQLDSVKHFIPKEQEQN